MRTPRRGTRERANRRRPVLITAVAAAVCVLAWSVAAQPAGESAVAADDDRASQWRLIGAGEAEHAWLLIPRTTSAGMENGQERTYANLYHLPATEPPGSVFKAPGHRVAAPPAAMTAWRDRLTLVYEPRSARGAGEGDASGSVRPVRSVETSQRSVGDLHRYIPADRYTVRESLPGGGRLAGFVETAAGPAALLRTKRDDAEDEPAVNNTRLLRLRDGEWRPIDLPKDFDESSHWRLVRADERIALYENRDGGGARLWRPAPSDETESLEWTSEPIAAVEPNTKLFAGPRGLLAVQRDSDGVARIVLLRDGFEYETARIEDLPDDHALFRLDETIVTAWVDKEADGRLRLAVVSAVSGRTLHRGFARVPPPIRPEDVRFLALLLGALLLGVLVFVLRPESLSGEASVPGGWAPAPPARRFAAVAIDLTVSGLAASLIWSAPLGEALDLRYLVLLQGGGAWPVLTALGLTLAHSAPAEWLWGRTLGKAIVRCRTVSTTGGGPALWQAATRNAVKLAAPPLTALLLIDPLRRHPGDVLSGTLVLARADVEQASGEDQEDRESGAD